MKQSRLVQGGQGRTPHDVIQGGWALTFVLAGAGMGIAILFLASCGGGCARGNQLGVANPRDESKTALESGGDSIGGRAGVKSSEGSGTTGLVAIGGNGFWVTVVSTVFVVAFVVYSQRESRLKTLYYKHHHERKANEAFPPTPNKEKSITGVDPVIRMGWVIPVWSDKKYGERGPAPEEQRPLPTCHAE